MTPTRRNVLLAGTATVALAATPIALGGLTSYLRRVLSDHFGADILKVDGIDDFITDYAALSGADDPVKRMAAEVYFAWRGDRIHKIGQAADLERLFLETILTRSNIIAVWQGRETALDYTDVNPWEPTCGLYLSALAAPEDDNIRG